MSGHGWVTPNPDGSKARCGGPAICPRCAMEKAGHAATLERERDEAYQVIDESHGMIVDKNTGRRWKELFVEAQEQIAKLNAHRRTGAEAVRELFAIADIVNSYPEAPRSDGHDGALGRRIKGFIEELRQQLADERQDHDITKRLLSNQTDKRWKLQQALEQVAATKNTKGRLFCAYCNNYTEDGHRDYCVVGPALEAVTAEPPSETEKAQ